MSKNEKYLTAKDAQSLVDSVIPERVEKRLNSWLNEISGLAARGYSEAEFVISDIPYLAFDKLRQEIVDLGYKFDSSGYPSSCKVSWWPENSGE